MQPQNDLLNIRLPHLLKFHLPKSELVQSLIKLNDEALSPQHESEKEIWDRLVRVFVGQLNVRPEEVIMGASIARDLGVD